MAYSAADHQKAYETFRETGNLAAAARAVACTYPTATQWSLASYRCPHGCPYHNWKELAAAANVALQAKVDLLDRGVFNPVVHEQAMKAAVTKALPKEPSRLDLANAIIRDDLQRLANWELLYRKVFFDLTGIPLDFDQISSTAAGFINLEERIKEKAMQEVYSRGCRTVNMESGVRNLQIIEAEIEKIRDRIREQEKPRIEEAADVSVTELRALRDQLRSGGMIEHSPGRSLEVSGSSYQEQAAGPLPSTGQQGRPTEQSEDG